jgi:hypothetical protein
VQFPFLYDGFLCLTGLADYLRGSLVLYLSLCLLEV